MFIFSWISLAFIQDTLLFKTVFYYRHYGTFLRNVKIPKKISKNDYCTLYLRRKKVWRDFRSYLLIIHSPGKGTRNRARFPILFLKFHFCFVAKDGRKNEYMRPFCLTCHFKTCFSHQEISCVLLPLFR